jgi:hypothetical protein
MLVATGASDKFKFTPGDRQNPPTHGDSGWIQPESPSA